MVTRKKLFVVGILALMFLFFAGGIAAAQTPAPTTQTTASNKYDVSKWAALATGLCIAIAAFGGALGQGNATKAALEGIARNPGARDKIFTPMIIGLALIESLVIVAFVVAFSLVGQLG